MGTFGQPAYGLHTIKQAIIRLLYQTPVGGQAPLMVYYVAKAEADAGLSARTLPIPPAQDSYYGGIDFEAYDESLLPSVIVTAQPTGVPERQEEGTYGQWFEVRIAAIVQADDEDQAQVFAECYGVAIADLLMDNKSLGGVANDTILTAFPIVEFLAPDSPRAYARSVTTVETKLMPVLMENQAPISWDFDPYDGAPAWPTVTTIGVRLNAELPAQ